MSGAGKTETLRLGFMETMEVDGRGHIGGLLITNQNGRPLEFQCTAPVRPNRTQELLYGPTLVPFLLGELLSKTLLERIGIKPHVVLTDRTEILDSRPHVALPVACVLKGTTNDAVRIGPLRRT